MISRYESPEIARIWSDRSKYEIWINIELLALKYMIKYQVVPLKVDLIPKINEIIEHLRIDMDQFIKRCLIEEQSTHHDVVAFINTLEKGLDPELGRFIHYGMTSSDLCDTQYALQMKASLSATKDVLIELRNTLRKQAEKYKFTPIIGRTHGRFAEPTTFGLILMLYVSELSRHIRRLGQTETRTAVGKLSGAVGTYAHIPPKIEANVLSELGLEAELGANQIVQRDRHAEVFNLLALIGCSLEKLATQIRHYSRDEVAEVFEPFGRRQKGSSAMPHKRNPIRCESICGMARILRGYAQTALSNVPLWMERDISHSSVERMLGPDAFGLLYFMIKRMTGVIKDLEVDEKQMKKNLDSAPWHSQTQMLKLIKDGMSRQKAHDYMQKHFKYKPRNQQEMLEQHLKLVEDIFSLIDSNI